MNLTGWRTLFAGLAVVLGTLIHVPGAQGRISRPDEDELDPVPPLPGAPLEVAEEFRLESGREAIRHVLFRPDGALLVATSDRSIQIWDMSGAEPRQSSVTETRDLMNGRMRAVAFSPDGTLLGIGCDDRTVHLFQISAEGLKELSLKKEHDRAVTSIAFTRDGRTLISGGDDQTVFFYNITNPQQPRTVGLYKVEDAMFGVQSLAVYPDSLTLVVAMGDGNVRVLDLGGARPRVRSSFRIPATFTLPLALSPDGKTLVFGSNEAIRIFDSRERVAIRASRKIVSVAFSPDGQNFASCGEEGKLIVWDAYGRERFEMQRPSKYEAVVFAPDPTLAVPVVKGRNKPPVVASDVRLACANENGTIYLERLVPPAPGKAPGGKKGVAANPPVPAPTAGSFLNQKPPTGVVAEVPGGTDVLPTPTPAPRPGMQPAVPAPAASGAGDYCTLLLAPRLQEYVELDAAQRVKCSELNERLKASLEHANEPTPGEPGIMRNAYTLTRRAEQILSQTGLSVREILRPEQDKKISDLLHKGELRPIQVAPVAASPRFGPGFRSTTYGPVALAYSNYSDAKAPGQSASAAAQPPHVSEAPRPAAHDADSEQSALAQVHSVKDAEQILAEKDPDLQKVGALWLAGANVEPGDHSRILALLRPHLDDPDVRRRTTYVQAYARWADASAAPTLAAILGYPAKSAMSKDNSECWDAVVPALITLDPDLCEKALMARQREGFFRVGVERPLKLVAASDSPQKFKAKELIDRLDQD